MGVFRRTAGLFFCHLSGIVIIGLVGVLVSGARSRMRLDAAAIPLAAIIGCAYLGAALIASRIRRFPLAGAARSALLSVIVAFGIAVLVLLMTRVYFSRSFLLSAAVMTGIWQAGVAHAMRRPLRTLAVVPGGMTLALKELSAAADWVFLSEPQLDRPVQGIVTDVRFPHSEEWRRFQSATASQGIPYYEADAAYEDLTGRALLTGLNLQRLAARAAASWYASLKRVVDTLIILLCMPVVLPLTVTLVVLIRLGSRGSVFFVQERVGRHGRPFRLYKLRTMREQSDAPACFTGTADPRVTSIGRWLRILHLDELPQLWNVLRGDMSLIGPRPEQVPFVGEFTEAILYYPLRHTVRPGITGWAQVHQGYAAGTDETRQKLEYDLYYVSNVSMWLDMVITLKTIQAVFTAHGAR